MHLPPFPRTIPQGVAWPWRVRDAGWVRIYHHDWFTDSAVKFRAWGPYHRFDHHTAPAADPAMSRNRSVLYLGHSIRAAAAEVFGDLEIFGVCPQWRLAWVRPIRTLVVQDIVGAAAMRLGTEPGLGGARLPRRFTQDCARRIYWQHRHLEGIRYSGRHEGGECLALWERAEPLVVIEDDGERCETAIRDPATWDTLLMEYVQPTGRGLEEIDVARCEYCQKATAAAASAGTP